MQEESGKIVGAVTDHGHTVRFESVQGSRYVENALGAGTDDRHWGTCQLQKIGRYVPDECLTAMCSANTARGKDSNPSLTGKVHRGRHRGGGRLPPRNGHGQIAPA